MAEAALIGGVAGGLLGAYGEWQRGDNAMAVAEMNAAKAEQDAKAVREIAADEERKQRTLGRKALGDIRTTYGASGVQTTTGSALDVLEESARNVELDALNIRYQGELQARSLFEDARISRFRGESTRSEARLGAAAQLLKAGSRAAAQGAG